MDIAHQLPTGLWVEHHGANTSLVGRLTFQPATLRLIKRSVLALAVWALTVLVGPSTLTFVQGLTR